MTNIQRTLIKDDGQHVVLAYNHYLGLVFVAFAFIPMLVPFKATSGALGNAVTSGGAALFAVVGSVLFLRRNALALNFRTRRFVLTKGFWPRPSRHEGSFEHIRAIDLFERRHGRKRPTYEVRILIDRESAAFPFFESPDREEALDELHRWQARFAHSLPKPTPQPTQRHAA
ncbi:MAG: hypothetical protein IT454_17150 [Planctomycetes bacterium]|nr:hypothetical protein [Planctomycetota bacterium]